MEIVTSELMVETVQHSRSPGRAARRARQGHQQHYITRPSQQAYILHGRTIVVHPAMLADLKRLVAQINLVAQRRLNDGEAHAPGE